MSTPNYWDLVEEEEEEKGEVTTTSVEEGNSRDTQKLTNESKSFKADKPFVSKKQVITLEKAAS